MSENVGFTMEEATLSSLGFDPEKVNKTNVKREDVVKDNPKSQSKPSNGGSGRGF